MAKCKKFKEGGEMPEDIVANIERKQNKEDRELITKPARAIFEGVKRMYNAATGKDAKDFEPRNLTMTAPEGEEFDTVYDTEAVRSPVSTGRGVRALNMGKKSTAGKAMKAGGTVRSSASKRADGCAVKGKTRGRMV